MLHLGRPIAAWKALRNLRHSWLSREVAALSLYAALAGGAAIVPGVAPAATIVGWCGLYTSARLYIVPGRPAWNTPLTVVRFFASAAAIGALATGHAAAGAIGVAVALGSTMANWWRLARDPRQPWWGAVRLELRWYRPWTIGRFVVAILGVMAAFAGYPIIAASIVASSEVIGRWLFFTTVVPLNTPGAFWRHAAGSHR